MKVTDCIFCKIPEDALGNESVFYDDEKLYVMLDADWAVKGHTLVIWKEHFRNMSDLSESDFRHFSDICRGIEKKLLEVLSLDKSIVLKSGGLESHFHFHIYPVDSKMSWNEVKNMLDKKVRYEPAEGEAKKLLEDLRDL